MRLLLFNTYIQKDYICLFHLLILMYYINIPKIHKDQIRDPLPERLFSCLHNYRYYVMPPRILINEHLLLSLLKLT